MQFESTYPKYTGRVPPLDLMQLEQNFETDSDFQVNWRYEPKQRCLSKQPYSEETFRPYLFLNNYPTHITPQDINEDEDLPLDPRDWTRSDVWKWLVNMLKSEGLDVTPELPQKFRMNGKALCLMSLDMYLCRVPVGDNYRILVSHGFKKCLRYKIILKSITKHAMEPVRTNKPNPKTFVRCDVKNKITPQNADTRPKMLKVTSSGEKIRYFIQPENLKQKLESQRSEKSSEITNDENCINSTAKTDANDFHQNDKPLNQHLMEHVEVQRHNDENENSTPLETTNKAFDLTTLHINIPEDSSDALEECVSDIKINASIKKKTNLENKSSEVVRRKRFTKKIKRTDSCSRSITEKVQPDMISLPGGYSLKKAQGCMDISVQRERELLYEQPTWRKNICTILFISVFIYLLLTIHAYLDEVQEYHEKFYK